MSAPATAAQIRLATEADANALAALARRTFVDTFADANTVENLHDYLDTAYSPALQRGELVDPAVCTLVAERDGALIAFAQLRSGKLSPGIHDPTAIEVQRFYVDRRAHGTGLAQQLMARCLADARERGAHTIFLGVWEQNVRAIRFYEARGFTEVGRQLFLMGSDAQQDLVLALPLAPSESATA